MLVMKPSTKIVKLMPLVWGFYSLGMGQKWLYIEKVLFYLREYSLLFIYSRGEIN